MQITLTPRQVELLREIIPTVQFTCTVRDFAEKSKDVIELQALLEKLNAQG